MRVYALYVVVAFLSVYAWKDWFKSLCGLILLMAVIEHEDMPKAMFGIQGLNPWNVLFVMIALAWATGRRREGVVWDMPRHVTVLLLMYLGVIVVGVLRAVFDRSHIEDYPLQNLISEELINTIKWVLPGLLLFDGCRTRRRVMIVLVCMLTMYSLIAVQVVRRLPPSSVFSVSGGIDETRRACSDIGYSACDMSTMLAGVSWAILATLPLIHGKKYRLMGLTGAAMVFYGQALTGGRAGYLAWGAVGLTLCLLRWRKYLLLAPLAVILISVVLPGAATRMLEGFGQTDVTGQATTDRNTVTSDRALFWPYIARKIGESPMIGHGRLAMDRTGLVQALEAEYAGIGVAQPHNIYLETLLDNGILGSLPIWLLWGAVILHAATLFRSGNRLYSAVGGLALSLTLAQLFAGIGSQHFYPEESTLGMWAAMLLALRVYVEEKYAQAAAVQSDLTWDAPFMARPRTAAFADGQKAIAR
jgi:hypothetical protein